MRRRSQAALASMLGIGLLGGAINSAQAEFIMDLDQVGSNVVANGSGTLDLTHFGAPTESGFGGAGIFARAAEIMAGASVDFFGYQDNTFFGPTNFGGGGFFAPDSSTGDFVGIDGNTKGGTAVEVSQDYVSGNPLTDSATWDNATFASLGVTPGTYTWTWGSGADEDSFVLNVGNNTAVPEPASIALFGTALAGFGAIRRRRRKPA